MNSVPVANGIHTSCATSEAEYMAAAALPDILHSLICTVREDDDYGIPVSRDQ